MTVCVAAITNNATVIGASDRMITSGGLIQFEPQQSKIVQLTTSIALMLAGDSSLQSEIVGRVLADVYRRIDEAPGVWWLIEDVANLYRYHAGELRRKRAEAMYLAPLGLTGESFLARQKSMEESVVRQLVHNLTVFTIPGVSAIVCGVDTTGAHIYVSDNENATCRDSMGFTSIGVGAWHSDSQMMFAGHTRMRPLPETLLLAYSAKKRAEIAPGVGTATDMFVIGPKLGSYFPIRDDVIGELDKIYKETQTDIEAAITGGDEKVRKYVDRLTPPPPSGQTPTKEGPPPANP